MPPWKCTAAALFKKIKQIPPQKCPNSQGCVMFLRNDQFELKFCMSKDLGMGITIIYLIHYNDASFMNKLMRFCIINELNKTLSTWDEILCG